MYLSPYSSAVKSFLQLALQALYMLQQIRLSIYLSVTLWYCVIMRERRGMRSLLSGSPVSLVFWCQEWLMGDDPVQVKFECKEVDPL